MLGYAILAVEGRHEKKYIVNLSESDRKHLQEIVGKGRHAASKIKRANILLKAMLRVRGGRMRRSPKRLGATCGRFVICENVFRKGVSWVPWSVGNLRIRRVCVG